MELTFNGGKFVSSKGELNYKEVLEHFPQAGTIRILTYNISRNQCFDKLMDALKNSCADIQIITNVPSRMEKYYDSDAGHRMKETARKNIHIYISKLNPDNFPDRFFPFFNVHNHAKIIGTEDIVYIGSANFSNESADNIETGVIIEDKKFIHKLYAEFFDEVRKDSMSYFDDNFSAFRLLTMSLYVKFEHHYKKIITDVYTDNERNKPVVADTIFISDDELNLLYWNLEEFESLCDAANETYDEENEDYNTELEELKEDFKCIDIGWLKETVSEDGSLYRVAMYDTEKEISNIMQTKYSCCAFDDQLDFYMQRAMNEAQESYMALYNNFFDQGEEFLEEMQAILNALEKALDFSEKWKASKINPEIDNT